MTAAAEIKAGALKARQEILKLDNQIHEEVAALEFAAFRDDRQPTAVELKKQAELERTQQELRKQLKILWIRDRKQARQLRRRVPIARKDADCQCGSRG